MQAADTGASRCETERLQDIRGCEFEGWRRRAATAAYLSSSEAGSHVGEPRRKLATRPSAKEKATNA